MRGTGLRVCLSEGAEQEVWWWQCHRFRRASGDGAGMLVTEKSELHSVRGTASVSTAYGEDCQRNACAQVDTLSEAGKLSRGIGSKEGSRGYPVSQGAKAGAGDPGSSFPQGFGGGMLGMLPQNRAHQQERGERTLQQRRPYHSMSPQEPGGGNYQSECPGQRGSREA